MLLARNIHTHQSWHGFSFLFLLALALLVARVCADHAHHAFAADDATVLADATNGTTYFHGFLLYFGGRTKRYYLKNRTLLQGGKLKI
jgi:hypothetical protein